MANRPGRTTLNLRLGYKTVLGHAATDMTSRGQYVSLGNMIEGLIRGDHDTMRFVSVRSALMGDVGERTTVNVPSWCVRVTRHAATELGVSSGRVIELLMEGDTRTRNLIKLWLEQEKGKSHG